MHEISRLRTIGLGLIAVLILFNYEIVRPAVEATFTSDLGYEALPKAWLAVAGTVVVAVTLFNRVSARVPLLRLLAFSAVGSAGLLALLLLARDAALGGATYALYVWKDVHIVFLIEAFWMFANTVYRTESAARLYGLFCAGGSLGAAAGARFSRWLLAQGLDTSQVLWVAAGIFVLISLGALLMHQLTPVQPREVAEPSERVRWRDGFSAMGKSRLLMWLLVLVLTTQLLINLVDYQFNGVVQEAYPDRDARTAAMSRVYEWISYGALAMQVLTGPLLKTLKLPGTMLALPLLVGGAATAMIVLPRFLTAAIAKVTTKVVDYSLFRATKELLYIPLTYREKVQGKAVIDILGYRAAKAGASLLLLGMASLGVGRSLAGVGAVIIALAALWAAAALILLRHYRAASAAQAAREAAMADAA